MSDDTTLNPVIITDPQGSNDDTNNEVATVPSHRLKEEADKRREAEAKLAEYEQSFKAKEVEVEKKYAKEIYGDVVDNEKVTEYKTKYPDLGYKEIFGALGIEVTPPTASRTPGRPSGSLSQTPSNSSYSLQELASLRESNQAEYNRVLQASARGEIKIV